MKKIKFIFFLAIITSGSFAQNYTAAKDEAAIRKKFAEVSLNTIAIKSDFVIEEVLIPNIRRAGGFSTSKFGKNPKMWFKIHKMLLDFQKDRK